MSVMRFSVVLFGTSTRKKGLADSSGHCRIERGKGLTYNVANFLGRAIIIGHNAKTSTKQARAPKLQPPNTNRRSQRLTISHIYQLTEEKRREGTAFGLTRKPRILLLAARSGREGRTRALSRR